MQEYEGFCCTEREVLVHWDSVCFVTWLYAEPMTKIYASYATHMTCVSDPRRTFTASSHLSLSSTLHSLWSESFATELPFLLFLLGTHSLNIIPGSHDDDDDEKSLSCCWDSDCLVAGYTASCILRG